MQLYLDSFGAFLSVRNGQFAIRTKSGGEQLFPVRQVGAILLTAGTALSTDAALLAALSAIPVLLIDAQTHEPLAQLSSGQAVSLAAIRRNQAVFTRSPEGFQWMGGILARKIEAQMALLQTAVGADADDTDLAGALKTMRQQARALASWTAPPEGFSAALTGERFRGQEGTASRVYFQYLGKMLDPALGFRGRQGHPAYDPFNAVLNYLYGMLYTGVHLALLKSGLDPYMAVLHADQYGAKPTMSYDLIEPFRPWADAVALSLANAGKLSHPDFFTADDQDRGLWLASPGKSVVIDAMLTFLNDTTPVQGRQVRRSVQIDLEAQQLATFLKNK